MRIVRGETAVGEYHIEPQIWCMVGKQLNVFGRREPRGFAGQARG